MMQVTFLTVVFSVVTIPLVSVLLGVQRAKYTSSSRTTYSARMKTRVVCAAGVRGQATAAESSGAKR